MPTQSRGHGTPKSSETAARWLARGNYAGAAAAGSATALALLVERLAAILEWPIALQDQWKAALEPVAMLAGQSAWPREKRALYDLQRIVADFTGTLDAVAPIEYLLSLGSKPIRRSLQPVKDVIVQRRLRQAAKQIARSTLPASERHTIEHLLEAEIDRFDEHIRVHLGPVIHRVFDHAGFTATSTPERIARDCIVLELLDRLSERGFLRLGDLRDAVARNDLKLSDCTLLEFVHGDLLLKIDKYLADDLFGVYHRGEAYLRGVQRFSSVAFGTRIGRWITLFVALPYGGAFLAIEAAKHIFHAATGLAATLVRVVEGTPAPEKMPHEHHGPLFTESTLAAIGILGTLLLLLIHGPVARRALFNAVKALVAVPGAIWRSKPVRLLLENPISRFISLFLLWPAGFAVGVMLLLTMLRLRTETVLLAGVASFFGAVIFNLSPLGRRLRSDAYEYGRQVLADVIPGTIAAVLWFFREVLGAIERILYAIDEWFRYREGQSKPSLALKIALALVWFPIAYVVRFAFFLLIEPQVNPIKHFPVVTVSHKVLLPLIPTVANVLSVSKGTATLLISGVPGIFGFLVWEFKENWRLYAANRPEKLCPVPLGHHGESMRGLLRPGFHSGTVPKLFRHLRHASEPLETDKLLHEKHHIELACKRLVERNLIAYWQTVPALASVEPRIESITLGVQRLEIAIAASGEPLRISFENIDGTIVASVDESGWLGALDPKKREIAVSSLNGLFAFGSARADVPWVQWIAIWHG